MNRTVYKAQIGLAYKISTAIMFIIAISFISYPMIIESGKFGWISIFIGVIIFFIGVFLVILTRTWYTFTDEGLKIEGFGKHAMMNEEYLEKMVPYSSMTGFHETRSVNYSVTFTANALRIEYRKMNGRKDSFIIGPVDKNEFIEELERRTGLRIKD